MTPSVVTKKGSIPLLIPNTENQMKEPYSAKVLGAHEKNLTKMRIVNKNKNIENRLIPKSTSGQIRDPSVSSTIFDCIPGFTVVLLA